METKIGISRKNQSFLSFAGFDEFMNVVVDEAMEVNMKTRNRNKVGRIMLKGDNITLIQQVTGEVWMEENTRIR